MRYLTLAEIERKYGTRRHTVRRWILRGWVKGKKVNIPITFKTGYKTKKRVTVKMEVWLVDEESFLEIPTFIRKRKKIKS